MTTGITAFVCVIAMSAEFVHPGLLHTRADLDRIRQMVQEGREPWKSGFEVFKVHSQSQASWKLRGPAEEIGRNPNVNFTQFDQDAGASYQCAMMWCITGDAAYAAKAKEIVNAWSATLKRVTGRDAVLMAGLGPFKMANAAEILRYTNTGWPEAEVRQSEQMFLGAIYPAIKDFAPFANGNWDLAAVQTVMAIGVFCDDCAIFDKGLRYYVEGAGNGRLTHYVINETGQCQESGRDQQHTQLGLALLSTCCEIAWSQGLDLYGLEDNRLLRGFEYTAKYNLGEDVPFVETLDRTGANHHTRISANGRGRFRAIYEQVYNHYVNRVRIPAPYTQRPAERIRPEGPGSPSADHVGFGTLLFSRAQAGVTDKSPAILPAAPGALVAQGSPSQIAMRWVASVDATGYAVRRSTTSGGPYTTIAEGIRSATYTDSAMTPGRVYYYVVSASNAAGRGPDAYERGVSAGLPEPWSQKDVGSLLVPGSTGFDGRVFTLEGAGTDIGAKGDQFQFAHVPMTGDGVICARFVPQLSSQFSKFGLMMRDGPGSDSAHVSLLLAPRSGASGGMRGWTACLVIRSSAGAETSGADAGAALAAPYVAHGRLMEPCWLRLERKGDIFFGSISPDGQTWTQVGSATLRANRSVLAGLAACSCLTQVITTVMFDNVTAPGWPKPPATAR